MKIQDLTVGYSLHWKVGIIHPKEGGMQVAGRAPFRQTVGYVLRILKAGKVSFQKAQSIVAVGFRVLGIQDYLIFLYI